MCALPVMALGASWAKRRLAQRPVMLRKVHGPSDIQNDSL